MLVSAMETTVWLGLLFIIVGYVIGTLKQKIDTLIERQSDEKERLQFIIDQMPVGVAIADSNGTIVGGNKMIQKILGHQMRTGGLAGDDTSVRGMHLDRSPVSASQWPLAIAFATGQAVAEEEYLYTRDDGREVYILVSASLIRNKAGNIIAAVTIVNDISEQKELERRKDDFINMASHELKTPLTSIRLYVDSLASGMGSTADAKTSKKTGAHIQPSGTAAGFDSQFTGCLAHPDG